MPNHQPVQIQQAFPVPGTPAAQTEQQEQLYWPQKPNGALILRIFDREVPAEEAARLNAEGFAVYALPADQIAMERDEAACTLWQQHMEARLDALLTAHPQLDAQRVGVDGWLAAYLIFHTERFAAAVQRPALINPTTAYGNCTAGWVERFGESLEEMMLALAEQSVLRHVDNCRTPCMVLWNEGEKRYSREQSEQLYAAMKDRNPDVACRMAVFTQRQWQKHAAGEQISWWKRFLTKEAQA